MEAARTDQSQCLSIQDELFSLSVIVFNLITRERMPIEEGYYPDQKEMANIRINMQQMLTDNLKLYHKQNKNYSIHFILFWQQVFDGLWDGQFNMDEFMEMMSDSR